MTVNGKPLTQVFKELREYKGRQKQKGEAKIFDYYPIEEYFSAFNDVVGTENYCVDYSELQYIQVKSGQDLMVCKCTITLLGDDGLPVLHKDGYGATDLVYAKDTGKDGGLKNEPHTATTGAFKSAAKWFGLFGIYEASADTSSSTATAEKARTSAPRAKKPEVKVSVHTKESFFSGGTENRTKKDIWKVKATLDSDKSECELIFYPNVYEKDMDKFSRLKDATGNKSVLLRCSVTECGEKNGIKQFVFKDYLPAA